MSSPQASPSAAATALVALLGALAAAAAPLEVTVRNAAGVPLADAAVYATALSGPTETRGKTMSIEQVDREFIPFLSVVQAGTTVAFPNRDPIAHHVYSFSPARPFEIKLYKGSPPHRVLFDKPGIVVLGCNIHDWMLAYVLVVPTPYFARTDVKGHARIELPAGSYELRAWHPLQKAEAAMKALAVESGPAAAMFTVDAVPRKPHYKPPLDTARQY
jgi:plastocyanin